MRDEQKTKKQLIDELQTLREQLASRDRSPAAGASPKPLPEPLEDFRKFSARLLMASINALPQLVHVVDADLRLKMLNQAILNRLEYHGLSTEALEKHVGEVFPFLSPQVLDEYRAVIQTRQAISTCERTVIDGREIFTETAKIPILDQDRVTHVVTVISDMTDYVSRERELRRERDLLDRVMETGPAGILVVDRGGAVTFANPAAERILRLQRADHDDRSYLDAGWFAASFERNDPGFLENPLREAARAGTPILDLSHDIEWPDGQHAELLINAAPLLDHEGRSDALVVSVEDITAREYIAAELRRSRDLFDRMLQVIPDMISIHDRDYRIHYSNWRGVGEVPPEKRIVGAKCHQIYRNSQVLCPDCRVPSVLVSKKTWHGQVKLPEGIWTDMTIIPLLDKRGEVELVVEWIRDVTAVKLAEESQAKSEERYRLLAENSIDVIWLMDMDGRIVYVSPSIESMTGFAPREIAGRSLDHFLTPDSAVQILDFIKSESPAADARCRQRLTGEFRQLNKLGEPIEVEIIATWVFDQYGLPVAMQGINRDVTDRKRAQQAYQLLAESSLQGMAVFQDGRIVFANPAFAEITGYSVLEIMQATTAQIAEVIHPDDRETVLRNMAERLEGAAIPANYSCRMIRKNGETCWVEIFSSVIEFRGKPAIQVLYLDITQRKRAEQEKHLLEEQLRQSQKMEAIGRLAGGVAHDFNNLLTAIGGFAAVVKNALDERDPLTGDVQEIINAAESAGKLTQQLLAFSRKQIVSPRIVNLNEVIARSEKMLCRIIGEDVKLLFQPAADLWPTRIDPGQIEQILVNLAVNARDAMPDVGHLMIATDNVVADHEPGILNPGDFSGEFVRLTVSDTGHGIEPEIITQIFEPFFTTKDHSKGTGLGLSTVYGVVRQNNGFLQVESRVGKGATFKIYLPKCSLEQEFVADPPVELRLTGSEIVLLVEDEPMVRKLARRILQMRGYRVLEAGDGGSALLLAEKHGGQIDLLLTDVVMPNMNGKELYHRVRQIQPNVNVLYMSGYTEDSITHRGILEPGTHFIQKPFHPLDLARKVRQAIDAER